MNSFSSVVTIYNNTTTYSTFNCLIQSNTLNSTTFRVLGIHSITTLSSQFTASDRLSGLPIHVQYVQFSNTYHPPLPSQDFIKRITLAPLPFITTSSTQFRERYLSLQLFEDPHFFESVSFTLSKAPDRLNLLELGSIHWDSLSRTPRFPSTSQLFSTAPHSINTFNYISLSPLSDTFTSSHHPAKITYFDAPNLSIQHPHPTQHRVTISKRSEYLTKWPPESLPLRPPAEFYQPRSRRKRPLPARRKRLSP